MAAIIILKKPKKKSKRKAKELGIYKKNDKSGLRDKTDNIIKTIGNLCFRIDDLETTLQQFEEECIGFPALEKFINYFKKTWLKYFRDETLNYSNISEQRYRSNSMLEGINSEIKKYFNDIGTNFM